MSSESPSGITHNFIAGKFTDDHNKTMEVLSPSNGQVISNVVLSNRLQLDEAVRAAKGAQASWADFTLKERVQVFFRFRALLEKHIDELTDLVVLENGKIPKLILISYPNTKG